MVDWETVAKDFAWDGSWRDVYVLDTTPADWTSFLQALARSGHEHEYRLAGELVPVPSTCEEAFAGRPDQWDRMLVVRIDGVVFHCPFFTVEEIELDLDPRAVVGDRGLRAVETLMRLLATATGKECILTPESWQHAVILRMGPDGEMA